mmetsp:Transcript_790/g.1591  ORF Transcript_790/g.1591 Transcript_790/m.1591 type:complete len:446 (-) Transcript_790:142-1479(-)|eukprot:scaffold4534_cov85-Amphora_coffeaeformis.AAC.2
MNRYPDTTTMNHRINNTPAEVRPGTVQAMIRRLQQQQQQQPDAVVLAHDPVKMGAINNVYPKDELPHGQMMTSWGSKTTAFPVVRKLTITNKNMSTTTSTTTFHPKVGTTTTTQTAQSLATSESSTNSSTSSSSSESRPEDHNLTRQPVQAPVPQQRRQEQSTLMITIPHSGWCRGSLCGNNDNDDSSVSSLEWSNDEDDEEDRAEYYLQKHLLREQEERRRIMQQHQRQQQLLLHLKHQRKVEQKQHEAEQRRRLALPITTAPHTVPHIHRAQQADPELRRFMMVLAVGTTTATKAHDNKTKTRILHPWERRRLALETKGKDQDNGGGEDNNNNNNNDDNICRHLSIRTVDGHKLVVYDETRVYIPEALQHDTKKYYYKLEMEETLRLELGSSSSSSSDEEEDVDDSDSDNSDDDEDDTKESRERKPVVPWKDRMKAACFWPDM